MSGDDFLETLQADVLAILRSTPSLVGVNIIAEDDGDMEAKIMRSLGTLKGGGTGKAGCVAVVMLPEITEAEQNLPGPPLVCGIKIQVIEQSLVNRESAGSSVRSSAGALRVLNALHLQSLGYAAMYAGSAPVTPVDVKKGFLSHMVNLTLQYRGLMGPGKPSAVEAELDGGVGQVVRYIPPPWPITGAGTVTFTLDHATLPSPVSVEVAVDGGVNFDNPAVVLPIIAALNDNAVFSGAGAVASPTFFDTHILITFAVGASDPGMSIAVVGAAPGLPTNLDGYNPEVAGRSPTLTLTCATSGAAIRYTLDGSYPTPAKGTLYSAPFPPPPVGTVVRAAAYKTGLNPGDVLEFDIRES